MGEPRFTFRRVNGHDPDTRSLLTRLHEESFPGYIVTDFRVGEWWLVETDGQAAGFCALWPSITLPGTAGYLARSAVRPQWRGHGLQRRMITLRERRARQHGWLLMLSDSVHGNWASANNLIRAGYTLWQPPRPWGAPDMHPLYWRKALQKDTA